METGGELTDRPVEVYIDGSYSSPDKAGIGIWWGKKDKRNFSAHSQQHTRLSDAIELEALIVLLERIGASEVSSTPAEKTRHFIIRTDSTTVIIFATVYIPAYREHGWQCCKSSHIKLLRYLDALLRNGLHRKIQITLKYVPGHSGIAGNVAADRLAKAGALLPKTATREWTADMVKLSEQIAAADLTEKPALTSRKRKRQQEEEEEEESTSEAEESDDENEEGTEGVGSGDESDFEDGDDDSESSEEGLDAQPSTKKYSSEESDDEHDPDSDESESEEGGEDRESDDESDSDDDDGSSESSKEDVEVQPATKKRKLNTGNPSEIVPPSKRALRRRRQRARERENKRLEAAVASTTNRDGLKLSRTSQAKRHRKQNAKRKALRAAGIKIKVSRAQRVRRKRNYRRNVKARRAAAAQSIKCN